MHFQIRWTQGTGQRPGMALAGSLAFSTVVPAPTRARQGESGACPHGCPRNIVIAWRREVWAGTVRAIASSLSINGAPMSNMETSKSTPAPAPGPPPFSDMIWIPGGEFRMGSEKHYPEERPVQRMSVDGFWMDRTPVTNTTFAQFVRDTGYVTFAEIPPNAADYPGAKPEMLRAGALVFVKPPHRVDLQNFQNWWHFVFGADWRHPRGPITSLEGLEQHPVVQI